MKAFTRFATHACLLLLFVCLILSACNQRSDSAKQKETEIAELLNRAATQQASEAKIQQVRFIDSAIQGRKLSVEEQVKVMEFKAGIYADQLADYDHADRIADSMIALVESYNPDRYKTEYAIANYIKGDVLFYKKQYNEAYTHYFKARLMGKTNLDSCTLSEYSFRLGLILYRQSRFNEAAETFTTALAESQTCNFDFPRYYRIQQIINNIGLSYYKAGMPDSSMRYFHNGLDYIWKHRGRFADRAYLNDIALAVVYGNLADIHRLRGNNDSAKLLLRMSIAINSQKGHDNMDAEYSQVKLADIYAEQHMTDSMLSTLAALRRSLDATPNPRAEMDWNRLMWKYHNSRNDARAAYGHLMRFTTLRDSLEKESSQLKTADLRQQIKMLEGQYQIQALQKENELKNVYIWIFVLASILAVLIVFLILRNLKRSRKNIRTLELLNAQVNQQKEQLQQALSEVEEKNKQQVRILRAVAHDLRGPVATISMLCDLILGEEDPKSRTEMVNYIKASCDNSLNLIAEILEVADQSRKNNLEKQPTNINALVENAVDLLRLKADEKAQFLITEMPEREIVTMVNQDKIKRVITNLVTNAIKFSEREKEIRVQLTANDGILLMKVRDQGIGIPENIRPKVFDMFTEARRKGTAGELPYGLGLSICKQIVEAHEGKIWFETETGKGTTFFVELPLSAAESAS
ncbi:MAG TPA: HAMP domain-containing sensor histidine kinase [Chitinophagaceae bacterium]